MRLYRKKFTLFVLLIITTGGAFAMNKTVTAMFRNTETADIEKITEADIKPLPEVVQNYLRFTNIIGKEKIKTVRLKQGGDFRLKPDQNFKTMTAEQYFNVDSIEFYWQGKVNIITAADKFIGGKGNMKVKLFGLIKVAEEEGPEIDQGEILRFLAEGVWFPSVFLNDYISWEALDDHSARATITYKDLSASAIFHFNAKNEIEKITAKRYMGKSGLKDWEIRILEYKEFHGVRIPGKSEVLWKLSDGDFCWYKPVIFDIEYNNPAIYE